MTAEVAVMNRIGVALAADSAVTIGQEANKIYTSADKLFQLSPLAPVGIMVYGNADFCGLPWETIIKAYRKSLGDTVFDTIAAQGEHFLQFLTNARNLFPQDRQEVHLERLVGSFLLSIRDYLGDKLDKEAEKRNGINKDDLPQLIEKVIEEILQLVQSNDLLPSMTEEIQNHIKDRYRVKCVSLVDEVFGTLPFSEAGRDLLYTLTHQMLVRHCFGLLECGVVIAGFGETEYMPSLVSYVLEEIVADIPRAVRTNSYTIGDDYGAAVIPFAQRDMVESFMEGIHGELYNHARDTTADLFHGAIAQILQIISVKDAAFAGELEVVLNASLQEMLERLFQDWKDRQEYYWKPVIEVVASLPKDELAAMAEALVNLTKFRRRVSAVRETVGGPIDVAIITKGDGFVWTQRKHYFDPTLNPRVISRLQRGL